MSDSNSEDSAVTDATADPTKDNPVSGLDTDEAVTEVVSAEIEEGPRRKARRERAERLAERRAQRAVNEKAQQESSSAKVDASSKSVRIRGIGLPRILIGSIVVAIGLVVASIGYFSPLMSVRSVVIVGSEAVAQEEVKAVLAVREGQPLLQVDTSAAAMRVASIPKIASARVQREYPSTLRVTVIERRPVVFFDSPLGAHLVDKSGIDYALEPPPPGVPRLVVADPGVKSPETKAALEVLSVLPLSVSNQLQEIAAPSISAISMRLLDGRSVIWGTQERTEEKALKLAALLTQPGQIYDISSPDLPTIR
ncbi:MAG: cell division protein FtsQ/DivIB [Mycobacteriaceae bacterium]